MVPPLAHGIEIAFESYWCGQISESVTDEDGSLGGLDIEAVAEVADDATSDHLPPVRIGRWMCLLLTEHVDVTSSPLCCLHGLGETLDR